MVLGREFKKYVFQIAMPLVQVELETSLGVDTKALPREKWDTWDPTLISEVCPVPLAVLPPTASHPRVSLQRPTSSVLSSWSTSFLSTLTLDHCRLAHVWPTDAFVPASAPTYITTPAAISTTAHVPRYLWDE